MTETPCRCPQGTPLRAVWMLSAALGCLLGCVATVAASPLNALQAIPQDTYGDPGVEALLARARGARHANDEGIDSYEAKLRQRIYVGLTAWRFRRERGLLEHERIARIRWSVDEPAIIQWVGVRTAIPIAGIDTGNPEGPSVRADASDSTISVVARREVEQDIAEDLLDETEMPGFDFEPGSDRLRFGDDDWALDPLSDTAAAHYRFASGDTLRLELIPNEDDIVLYEILVEPRRADFFLVAGSLWFDAESGSLVRATYKPARPFNLGIDEPGDSEDVPGFLQPIEAEIEYVTVEYSLQESRYWLPRRFAFQGEARVGSVFRIPLTLEWNVSGYVVNDAQTDLLADGALPEGWRRQENIHEDADGNERTVLVIVPTARELRESPDLSETFGERSPVAFSAGEIERLGSRLEGLLPTYRRFRPQLAWGLQRGMVRFNRVEGISAGSAATVPLTPTLELDASVRLGASDREPNLTAALLWGPEAGRWTAEGYHRLESMSDNGDPFGLVSSGANLLLGTDRGEYYQASGFGLGYRSFGTSVRFDVGGFYERQRPIEFGTDFFLLGSIREDTVDAVLSADALDVAGGRASVRWFSGIDPNALLVTAQLDGEIAGGDASYRRMWGGLSASHPLPFRLAGAVEVGGGALWGKDPVQRQFFLGGSGTVRGLDLNEFNGQTYWRARGELATGFAAARIGVFSDLGWTGSREDFRLDDPFVSVGVGTSLLDGLVRFDVARAVRRASRWKVHLYLDGLF